MNLHPAKQDVTELLKECEVVRTRRSGPGGQHRNKVETAIVLTHTPTGIRGEASEERSQRRNREEAERRLRLNLAIHVRCEPSGAPSELWQARCPGGRIDVSTEHSDFPALIAEALDVLVSRNLDHKAAAEALTCSSSQFVKLLRKAPVVFQWVNTQRKSAGLHQLK